MTKMEMINEMAKATYSRKLDQSRIDALSKHVTKERTEQVYNEYLKDKEHAKFYFNALVYYQW